MINIYNPSIKKYTEEAKKIQMQMLKKYMMSYDLFYAKYAN
jgi:hypothetical protein